MGMTTASAFDEPAGPAQAPSSPTPLDAQPSAPPLMDSPAATRQALLWGFGAAMAQRARSITCVSTRFDDWWPLDDANLLRALALWLRLPQRCLVLVAADYSSIGQRWPRFDRWRRDWVHAVPARRCSEDFAAALPEALFDDARVSVRLLDAETGRGRAAMELRPRLQLAQQTDVVLQRSEPAWASKTLGL